jgi:hypothetical protein
MIAQIAAGKVFEKVGHSNPCHGKIWLPGPQRRFGLVDKYQGKKIYFLTRML